MRKTLAAFALVLLGLVGTPSAQDIPQPGQLLDGSRGSFPGCPDCGVWSWVDYPRDQRTVAASNFYVQGWGFECVSGRPIDRVDVYYQDYEGIYHPVKQPEWALLHGAIGRPDVVAAFAGACPNVAANSGWQLRVTGIPPGLRRVTIVVWRGPYRENHDRTYLILDR